jgi:fructose-1,6-bisphosphatase II
VPEVGGGAGARWPKGDGAGCLCDDLVRVTEAAALAAAEWIGRDDCLSADLAAARVMREALDRMRVRGTVVVGKGGAGNQSGLKVGDELGHGDGPAEWEFVVDPLEGRNAVARGQHGALSVAAAGRAGTIMRVPDMYMEKIVVGAQAASAIDIDASVTNNIRAVAAAYGLPVKELRVMILDRPRHEELIAEVRRTGARVMLICDGDISAAIVAAARGVEGDMVIGIGGSTAGLLTAAAMRCLGGSIQARFWPVSRHQVEQARALGIEDIERRLSMADLVGSEVIFAATAVTRDRLLKGVEISEPGSRTETLVMCSHCDDIRLVRTLHRAGESWPGTALWNL